MRAGALDRRIILKHRELTRNDYGEQVESWEPYDTVWAQKVDVSSRELFTSSQTIAENTTRFRIRYRDDVLSTDLIEYAGAQYDIKQIAEFGRNKRLEIVAVARV